MWSSRYLSGQTDRQTRWSQYFVVPSWTNWLRVIFMFSLLCTHGDKHCLARRPPICCASVSTLFLKNYFSGSISHHAISKSTIPIFAKFSGLVDVWKGFIKRSFILRSLKGCCHGNQFKAKFCEISRLHPYSVRWRSETVCRSQFRFFYTVEIWWDSVQ